MSDVTPYTAAGLVTNVLAASVILLASSVARGVPGSPGGMRMAALRHWSPSEMATALKLKP